MKPNIPDDIYARIVERLEEVEREFAVRILFAAESGSRAWGFPSPDSDFDVRFIYTHPTDWYLSLHEQRDVIECGVDHHDIDLSGWDIRKALRLLLKSNAALYEWTRSPIIYREDTSSRQEIQDLFERNASQLTLAMHYLEYAKSNWRRTRGDDETIKLKRYFYVMRPLIALEWVMKNADPPPMQVQDLLAQVPLPDDVRSAFQELLEVKLKTPELGRGPRVPVLDAWIAEKLETPVGSTIGDNDGHERTQTIHAVRSDVEDFFQRAIRFS
ncbi:MAG: nucleotidyltransferase domain-containing protein [Pseudomonadota bacterium]